ncbi:MAG: glycosyltransferase [Candidatus Lernaella stagnicola]|nr:glycosyltransferase [Candidatus Lernaella stagnicola]
MKHVLAFLYRWIRLLPPGFRFALKRWLRLSSGKGFGRASRANVTDELQKLRGETSETVVVFLPSHPWFSIAFQRPQQMARALAECGAVVVYAEIPGRHDDLLSAEGRERAGENGLQPLDERLWHLRVPEHFLRKAIRLLRPDAQIFSWPHQVDYLVEDVGSTTVYEMIDDHALLPDAAPWWHATHAAWVRRADIVVASADRLLSQLRRERDDAMLLPNATSVEDWRIDPPPSVPEDMREARRAETVVGYYGIIESWFDFELWAQVAAKKTRWSFVLVGHATAAVAAQVDALTSSAPNIFYLGSKPYAELPAYLAHMDIATIPFKLNDVTHATSPLKLFEYMAAGKPIVATPMREIIKYKSVLWGEQPGAFVRQLESAVTFAENATYRETLAREAAANTWTARAAELLAAIRAKRSPSTQ